MLIGREVLAAELSERVRRGQCTVLVGMAGCGKSALLDMVRQTSEASGHSVIRLSSAAADAGIRYSAVADLFTALPQDGLAEIPRPQQAAVNRVLRRDDGPDPDVAALRFAAQSWLDVAARQGKPLLALDDIQWWDPASADVLGYVIRRNCGAVPVLAATRPAGPSTAALLGRDTLEVRVPALTGAETAALLAGRGVPFRLARRIHAAAGGNPQLVAEMARGLEESGSRLDSLDAVPLSQYAQRAIRSWLAALPEKTRSVLLIAALAVDPALTTLRRASGPGTTEALAEAESAGLVASDGRGALTFPASAVRDTLISEACDEAVRHAHRILGAASPDPADRLWHSASASDRTGQETASALSVAASAARDRGDRGRSADFLLLAADRTPPGVPVAPLLLQAAVDAGAAGRLDLARTALTRLDKAESDLGARAKARIAFIDAVGQALAGLEDVLALALADAEAAGDPALLSAVHLRFAWHAHLALGLNQRARAEARRAVRLAEEAGDTSARAAALVMLARVQQMLGSPESSAILRRALDCGTFPDEGGIVNSPHWAAVRFALFDDRLDEARHHLRGLTPVAERSGSYEDLSLVLRAAVEIEARSGNGLAARRFAERLTSLSGIESASPGPVWYTAALAEMAGGSLEQALGYAEFGAGSSVQERDQVFLTRCLQVSGMIRLLMRDAAGAAEDLRRVRGLERAQRIADPATVRYHADLVEALVALGDVAEAHTTIVATRRSAAALNRRGVLASLDRAEGVYQAAMGDFTRSGALLHRSERRFAGLGLPLERARVLLAQSAVDKRRRRVAPARASQSAAEAVFKDAGAPLWAPAEPSREQADGADRPGAAGLTASEARVAKLAAEGCGNKEIATTLFLSVKTVEAVLTRVYRKLGVRTRTQLSMVLRAAAETVEV